MPHTLHNSREPRALPAALPMVGAAFILFLVVVVFTGRNIQQTERSVARLLAERGNAIIEIFESSLRSDMRTRSGLRVQELLEDLASREDILFVAVTLGDGEIIAHSDSGRVGGRLQADGRPLDAEILAQLHERGEGEDGGSWALMRMEGHRAFVVHRALFRPRGDTLQKNMPLRHSEPARPEFGHRMSRMTPERIQVFVGQDARLLQTMQEQNMRSALLSGMLVLLTALTGIAALRYFERGMESRRRMREAEKLAQSMVDEVKRLEKEMLRREKQAAVGDLAAGVAHELRNPLSSIKGYATYFGSRFPEDSEDHQAARIMVQEVDRLNRVITDLIGVTRPTHIHPAPTDMGRLVDDILRLLSQDAGQRGVELRREGPSVFAWIDPDRLRQAVLNVCLNAVEAMPDGGTVRLCLSSDENHVMLDVVDNGPGIPSELLSRVFDPYFTTKSQGTGLGLVMVMNIVEAHGGSVQLSSEPGQGTTVHFSLPRRPPEPVQSPSAPEAPSPPAFTAAADSARKDGSS
ncbi:MAG: two-component system sensor histidine kinase ZraS [Desulfovibrionaceae bacterium]|nr:two-component system sensor histidine kinase ZraS [Desulfovibrionaceae bacterium]